MAANVPPGHKRREGYRGFVLENLVTDRVVAITKANFKKTREKLLQYPDRMTWPTFGDLEGAKLLVDAVIERDAGTLYKLHARFPEYDLELGEWWDNLQRDFVQQAAIKIRVIKTKTIAPGRTMRLEIETDTDTGNRAIVASIYRGQRRIARKVMKQETAHGVH